jgi:uncharacterized protein
VSSELPAAAACRHLGAREGFEVLFPYEEQGGYRFDGHSTAVEDREPWGISYSIALDTRWVTRSAQIVSRSAFGTRELRLEADGEGEWLVDSNPLRHVAGCLDVDLEASAFTNTFPVLRLGLGPGRRAEAPAAYVRAPDLRVERLEQSYARLDDDGPRMRFDYSAPVFDFQALLTYDEQGLVLDYPGLAVRVL